jgi:hypothetical protein
VSSDDAVIFKEGKIIIQRITPTVLRLIRAVQTMRSASAGRRNAIKREVQAIPPRDGRRVDLLERLLRPLRCNDHARKNCRWQIAVKEHLRLWWAV